MSDLQVRFKSLKDNVSDVIVKPAESGGHFPIRYLDSLIEDYLNKSAYIYLHLRAGAESRKHDPVAYTLGALRTADPDVGRTIDPAAADGVTDVVYPYSRDRDNSMLVPIVCFVEQPEGMILDRADSWIWTQPDDLTYYDAIHVLDAFMPWRSRKVKDRKGDILLILVRQTGLILDSQSEGKVVERTSHRLKSIANDEFKVVGERLKLFAEKGQSSIALGVHADFVTLAVRDPVFYETFDLLNMGVCAAKFSPVIG